MNNALVLRNDAMPETLGEIIQLGGILAASGYFQDAKSEAQAVAKLIAGREWGIGPMSSMTGIHVIQGKPTMGAGLIASQIKRSGKYDFRVAEITDQACEIVFYQFSMMAKEEIGRSRFTMEEARKAQVKNLDKFPRNMLYARAMSNGARWFCPDAFTGPVYTPEELGATVEYDNEGQERVIVDVAPVDTETKPAPQQRVKVSRTGMEQRIKELRAEGNTVSLAAEWYDTDTKSLSDTDLLDFGKRLAQAVKDAKTAHEESATLGEIETEA